MAERKRIGEGELKALVAREIALAKSDRSTASDKQTKALEYFQGEMKDIPPEVGRSKAVSRDLADTMGWMLPGIIRVFTASEHMAIAEPVGIEDEAWSEQATDGINHVFWKDNDGYRIVHSATWDSLIGGNGVVKTWFDETPEHSVSFHSGLGEDAFTELVSEEGVEVIAHTERTEMMVDPATGEQAEMPVHDLKIKRIKRYGCTKVLAIAPEDYGIDSAAKTCEDARFQYHRAQKTRSELIEMGFDRAIVESLGQSADNDTSEEIARDERVRTEDGDPSTEIVDLYECYIKVDIDGDGIAETVKVDYAGHKDGGEILDWAEWEDETPFDDIPCDPMPHRWEARSVADETMDVQQIKTVLLRQALDNVYATNNPQRFVTGKISNPDELFSPSFGGAIFGEVNATVTPLTVPFVANHAFDAINYQDQVIERRTGVSRQTMALDPDALQNQTATANQNAKDAAYSQIELIARNQAELGWKKVFRKILRLEIKHQDRPRTIRMRGKFVEIDPRHWNADMDISINVGLGTGSRDRDMQMLQTVLANQTGLSERLAMVDPGKSLEMLPYIMTTLKESAEAAGIKSPEKFYPEVTPEDIAAGQALLKQKAAQPDPKIAMEQQKLQASIAEGQAKLQMDGQKAQQDAMLSEQKMQQDIILQREKMQGELMLKREQIAAEMELKREQLAAELVLKRELSMQEMEMKKEQGFYAADKNAEVGRYKADATSGVYVGGNPG